jgi:hypothetical protein
MDDVGYYFFNWHDDDEVKKHNHDPYAHEDDAYETYIQREIDNEQNFKDATQATVDTG